MANFDLLSINDISVHVWAQITNILGSAFLGIAIYSYFYKKISKKDNQLLSYIHELNCYLWRISDMSDKTDVKLILDAVAGFNDSINGFKDNIINTVKDEVKEVRNEFNENFKELRNEIRGEIRDIKDEVETLKNNAGAERTQLQVQKNKLTWTIGIGMTVFGVINSVIVYWIIKGIS